MIDPTQGANDSGGGNSWGDVVAQSPQVQQPSISNAANAAVSASQQQTTPAPQQTAAPPAQQDSALQAILHAVGNALGGGQTNPNGSNRTTGQKIGSGIATIVRGAAAGASQRGAGAFGKGAVAGMNEQDQFQQQQQNDFLKQQENTRQNQEAQQKQLLTNASLAKSNMDMATMAFNLKRAGIEFNQQQAAVADSMAAIKSIPGSQMIGHFEDEEALTNYLDSAGTAGTQQHAKDLANNLIRIVPNSKGGFDAYQVPKGWADRQIGDGKQISLMSTVMGKDGKPTPVWKTVAAPPDMTMGDYLKWQGSTLDASTKNDLQQSEITKNQADATKATAEGKEANARIGLINQQAKQLIQSQTADPFGYTSPLPQKEALKRQDSFQSQVVNKAYDVEKSYNMAQQAYQEYKDAAAKGQELPTGAQSMLLLSQHLSTTFGGVKGSRITKDMIAEHLGARGLSDSAVTAVQKLSNGDQLSPDQWKAFTGLISQSRNETWNNAISNAKNQQLPISFLPRGNGRNAIDPETAKIYLNAADGDPKKAAAAAQKQGWLVQ
jgi:hypothetical protein